MANTYRPKAYPTPAELAAACERLQEEWASRPDRSGRLLTLPGPRRPDSTINLGVGFACGVIAGGVAVGLLATAVALLTR